MQPHELICDAAADPGHVFEALSARYAVEAGRSAEGTWTPLDTADWRLHRAQLHLQHARRGREATLQLSGPELALSAPSPRGKSPWRLGSLADSPLRTRIAPALGVRALLPLAEVKVRSLHLNVLDGEQKTRVRVQVDQQRLVAERTVTLPLRLLVSPVRGYERDAERCLSLLTQSIGGVETGTTAVSVALAAAGRVPGQPPMGALVLDPYGPALDSLTDVLRYWVDAIDAARPGVLDDVDPEFLDDLAVAAQAMQSVLKFGGYLLPGHFAEHVSADLHWLGELASPLRALDLALVHLDGDGELDVAGLSTLSPLLAHLAGRRRAALRAVRLALRSPRGNALVEQWRLALDSVGAPDLLGPDTRDVAIAQVQTAYDQVLAAGRDVTDHAEVTPLLRRTARLSHLLNSYASVLGPATFQDVLAASIPLHDAVTDIRDSEQLAAQLTGCATALARRVPAGTLLDMGALRDRAAQRATAARRRLPSAIAALGAVAP